MTKNFSPVSFEKLLSWVLNEYRCKKSIFGIPEELFFTPNAKPQITIKKYGNLLETPIGIAAGPHTQMAQNIISGWLCGARFIELKTVQTLDELNISKPCIDMQDEGYNCEWSQELKLKQSFDEYLKAWIIIHILRHKFKHNNGTKDSGMIFNMSVGYNMEDIKKHNVQDFLNKMKNAEKYIKKYLKNARKYYPDVLKINIPNKLSNNITLSTMHGCLPSEIEKIAAYLIKELDFHVTIKFNPTLLGKERLREILNEKTGFDHITVPDEAFEHDPLYEDAVKIINSVLDTSKKEGKDFSVKLSNTLEVINNKDVFSGGEKTMYMSGRALHPIVVNIAAKLISDFKDEIKISFSGGADAFNIPKLVSCNIMPVTVCSDILKPGGYGRLHQCIETLVDEMKKKGAENLFELLKQCAALNISRYAKEVIEDKRYHKDFIDAQSTKNNIKLQYFDCISAPCVEECPVSQKVSDYMYLVSNLKTNKAHQILLQDNPICSTAGRACDHPCQMKCVRTNYDKPLAIKEIKRFITDNAESKISSGKFNSIKTAIIGSGPSGISCAYFLAREGCPVTIFEEGSMPGGMLAKAIPPFRLPSSVIKKDIKRIKKMGVKIKLNQKIGKDITFKKLKESGFDYIYIACGAQKGIKLGLVGENLKGVYDSLDFLYAVKLHSLSSAKRRSLPALASIDLLKGKKIGIIGAGNSACDAARTSLRLMPNSKIKLIYRRTQKEMPANKEEINQLKYEGIQILELTSPLRIIGKEGRVKGLECIRMKLDGLDNSGRRKPVPVKDSEFTIDLDIVIVAIGQRVNSDFLKESSIELSEKGAIKINPATLETSVRGIYAGGDAVRGPSSLIKAAGDGKKAAFEILKKKINSSIKINKKKLSGRLLLVKKSKKIYPEFSIELPLNLRKNMAECVRTMTNSEAKKEAGRCLSCDTFCSICDTVCPNRANITYEISPVSVKLPAINISEKGLETEGGKVYEIKQKYQIANIGDLCNECGNCTTFCPTKGAPYKDKPRIYINKSAFEACDEDAYYFKKNKEIILFAKKNKKIHALKPGKNKDYFIYESPELTLTIDKSLNFSNIKLNKKNIKGKYLLNICAEMLVLYRGITKSSIYLFDNSNIMHF